MLINSGVQIENPLVILNGCTCRCTSDLGRISARGVAPIDHKSLARGERGKVGTEKQHHVGDLVRLREPAERRVHDEKLPHFGIILPMFRHRRLH